ncbi:MULTISPECIES: glycosyltransferase [unclassified Luteococcus]|uniref:glycosyltransferase n=1 Tax=unclassified Luteococcus TaxID=2639923 RepID=UPI00313C6E48
MASIIIPAHNEATVIGRTLESLADGTLRPDTLVVVACNGCTDGTEQIVRGFDGRLRLETLEMPAASKQSALNAAEAHLAQTGEADNFPRIFLDADIAAPAESLNEVFRVLESGRVLAARPPLVYRTEGVEAPVKAYYDARMRTPEVLSALWGAGVFAVGAEGRARWAEFPADAPDDLFVDALFSPEEKCVVAADPVPVEVPRTTRALVRTLKRVYRPSQKVQELGQSTTGSSGSTLKSLLKANSGSPRQLLDAGCYCALAVAARLQDRLEPAARHRSELHWERDDTTR